MIHLKAFIKPVCLARVASWLTFFGALSMGQENGETKANQEIMLAKHACLIGAFSDPIPPSSFNLSIETSIVIFLRKKSQKAEQVEQ